MSVNTPLLRRPVYSTPAPRAPYPDERKLRRHPRDTKSACRAWLVLGIAAAVFVACVVIVVINTDTVGAHVINSAHLSARATRTQRLHNQVPGAPALTYERWSGVLPFSVTLHNVIGITPDGTPVSVDSVYVDVGLLASLWHWRPAFDDVRMDGMSVMTNMHVRSSFELPEWLRSTYGVYVPHGTITRACYTDSCAPHELFSASFSSDVRRHSETLAGVFAFALPGKRSLDITYTGTAQSRVIDMTLVYKPGSHNEPTVHVSSKASFRDTIRLGLARAAGAPAGFLDWSSAEAHVEWHTAQANTYAERAPWLVDAPSAWVHSIVTDVRPLSGTMWLNATSAGLIDVHVKEPVVLYNTSTQQPFASINRGCTVHVGGQWLNSPWSFATHCNTSHGFVTYTTRTNSGLIQLDARAAVVAGTPLQRGLEARVRVHNNVWYATRVNTTFQHISVHNGRIAWDAANSIKGSGTLYAYNTHANINVVHDPGVSTAVNLTGDGFAFNTLVANTSAPLIVGHWGQHSVSASKSTTREDLWLVCTSASRSAVSGCANIVVDFETPHVLAEVIPTTIAWSDNWQIVSARAAVQSLSAYSVDVVVTDMYNASAVVSVNALRQCVQSKGFFGVTGNVCLQDDTDNVLTIGTVYTEHAVTLSDGLARNINATLHWYPEEHNVDMNGRIQLVLTDQPAEFALSARVDNTKVDGALHIVYTAPKGHWLRNVTQTTNILVDPWAWMVIDA